MCTRLFTGTLSYESALEPAPTSHPAPGTRTADRILYVGLNGVVHHEAVCFHPKRGRFMSPVKAPGSELYEWTRYLVRALAPYPHLALVLSSSWCIRPGYERTLRRLPASMRERFIGGTFHSRVHGADQQSLERFRRASRYEQILADVGRRNARAWLAIDDEISGWPVPQLEHLVACDGSTGLSDVRIQRELASKLKQLHGR